MKRLRTQDEIIASWKGDLSKPIVSICCITYNHEHYIEEALNSFLIQETNFPFEIIVQDDASSDYTANIIKKYEENYPRLIKAIYYKENQYSQGHRPSLLAFPFCKGDYIAICEGDDFWTCSYKLQKQVETLKLYPHINMCIHSANCINTETNEEIIIGKYGKHEYEIIPTEYIIEKTFGQIPTASTMIKRTITQELINFMSQNSNTIVGDIYLHFFGSKNGGAIYINEPMSCYRLNTIGSFTHQFKNDSSLRLRHLESRVSSYLILDQLSSREFSTSFKKSNLEFIKMYFLNPFNSFPSKIKVYLKYFTILNGQLKLLFPLLHARSLILVYLPKSIKLKIKKLYNK